MRTPNATDGARNQSRMTTRHPGFSSTSTIRIRSSSTDYPSLLVSSRGRSPRGYRPRRSEEFAELMGGRGISNEHTVVIYGDRNNWYFRYYGHRAVKLMNGPRENWIAEGHDVSVEVGRRAERPLRLEGRDRRRPPGDRLLPDRRAIWPTPGSCSASCSGSRTSVTTTAHGPNGATSSMLRLRSELGHNWRVSSPA